MGIRLLEERQCTGSGLYTLAAHRFQSTMPTGEQHIARGDMPVQRYRRAPLVPLIGSECSRRTASPRLTSHPEALGEGLGQEALVRRPLAVERRQQQPSRGDGRPIAAPEVATSRKASRSEQASACSHPLSH
jgi:hypothetical protein